MPPTDYKTVRRTTDAAPDEAMQIKLNIWVPAVSGPEEWPEAGDSGLLPNSGKSFYLDVDKVYADTVTPGGDTTAPTVTINSDFVHTFS